LSQLERLYERARISIGDDGLELHTGLYDPATGSYEAVSPPEFANGYPAGILKVLTYAGNIRSGMHATMFARAVVYANEYYPSAEKTHLAANILNLVERENLTNYNDPDDHLLPEMQWNRNIYSGDAVANWLWAYWQGRYRGFWN
jgi:hypothetical protein